jgi:hypothetical protein
MSAGAVVALMWGHRARTDSSAWLRPKTGNDVASAPAPPAPCDPASGAGESGSISMRRRRRRERAGPPPSGSRCRIGARRRGGADFRRLSPPRRPLGASPSGVRLPRAPRSPSRCSNDQPPDDESRASPRPAPRRTPGAWHTSRAEPLHSRRLAGRAAPSPRRASKANASEPFPWVPPRSCPPYGRRAAGRSRTGEARTRVQVRRSPPRR